MKISLISKYRTQLMGIAILLVALFHSSIKHANQVIDFSCFCGDMGVDIFFIISGFGMYYSFQKKVSLKNFFMKRFVRIVPVWICVNMFIQFYNIGFSKMNWIYFAKVMTGFLFWLEGNLFFWYIPCILAFYLMTPLFMKMYLKNKFKAYLVFGIVWILLLGICIIAHNSKYFIFLFRWPAYFLGIYLGELSFKKIEFSKKYNWLNALVMIVGIILLNIIRVKNETSSIIRYDYKYFIYVIVAIPMCILAAQLFQMTEYKFPVLSFLGKITLEIYLIHEFILRVMTGKIETYSFDKYLIVYNLIVFIIAICIAYLLHKIFDYIGLRILKLLNFDLKCK
ncbi:MAG: acyltransferase [Lachnospiraceae bacterium]|nr:acyltransferase [Lachnospiraceae bacterium]